MEDLNPNALQRVIAEDQARLNITYANQNGELRDPIPYNAPDADIIRWATEAVGNGDIAGIEAQPANFRDFVVQRFGPTAERPYNLVMLRPKTPFGAVVERGDVDGRSPVSGKPLASKLFKPSGSTDAVDPKFLQKLPVQTDVAQFNVVKVFSATKHTDRAVLGEQITNWLRDNPDVVIVDKIVTQSSDNEFHCLAITLFGLRP